MKIICLVHILGKICITEAKDFHTIYLYKPVLITALSALNNLRGDALDSEKR